MADRCVELWLTFPEINPRNPQHRLFAQARKLISSECKVRGWNFNVVLSRILHPDGRYTEAIPPDGATNLYKRAHNARIGVWQFGNAYVPVRPMLSKNPKHYQELGRFLHHKAFHFKVGKGAFADVWESSLGSFQEWLDRVDCEGQSDPRCLPFHIFKTVVPIGILATEKERKAFSNTHGAPSNRHDGYDLRWRSPRGALHGGGQLHISGYELEKGFHWDVDSGKGRRTVITTEGEWTIQRGEYLNIYPDGYVRPGNIRR